MNLGTLLFYRTVDFSVHQVVSSVTHLSAPFVLLYFSTAPR